jgi:DnaJ family protein C protein 7
MMLKKYDDALSDCKAATSLDPSFTKGYMRGAKCYSQRGMLWEAKDMLQKVLARDAASAEAIKEMASIEQLEKDIAEAKAKLAASDYDRASYYVDRILPLCPDATSVMAMRAELLIGRKKFDDAASITWALLAKDRNNPDLLHLRGKALLYGGSSDQAMKHFQEALRVDPDHARARNGLKGNANPPPKAFNPKLVELDHARA